MNLLSRVVWSEGMYLGPHHFQAQNRYSEDSLNFSSSALFFKPYGLIGYALDPDALKNGTVALLHARGLFEDGLAFQMPECDRVPDARPLGTAFPATRDSLDLFLGIPKRAFDNHNGQPPASQSRITPVNRTYNDEVTGRNERQISVGQKNLSLLFETESRAGYETLRIGRILRDGAGNYAYDPKYIPPCVQISASEPLMLGLRQIIEILHEKGDRLASTSTERSGDFVPRDLANYWLLHAVNSGLASLTHLWSVKRSHPDDLYVELCRLAGALCTFSLNSHPRELPLYNHEELDICFEALFAHIRKNLEVVIPTNCVLIPLEKTSDFFWAGTVPDSRYLTRSRWVLGIQSNLGEADLIVKTPGLVKVCSSKFVAELVKRAMAGLTLTHLTMPPPAVPAKVEAQYFGITKSGPFWDHIVQTRGVGIYVPGDIPQPRLELFVVMET
ncbi:MAG: type VI secretion system baseplate subunit TssK [Bryobacteraceae bacterium]|nr:type VI secretion system baseplate subunit TssK [Bryobacteraceae bacterium]